MIQGYYLSVLFDKKLRVSKLFDCSIKFPSHCNRKEIQTMFQKRDNTALLLASSIKKIFLNNRTSIQMGSFLLSYFQNFVETVNSKKFVKITFQHRVLFLFLSSFQNTVTSKDESCVYICPKDKEFKKFKDGRHLKTNWPTPHSTIKIEVLGRLKICTPCHTISI